MPHDFAIVDVFTSARFGGNPLAVVFDADDLSPATMQSVAAEFGFSETTFVQTAVQPGHDFRVRIFTPRAEIGFAGHPNLGTAFALVDRLGPRQGFRFQQAAGSVSVTLDDRRAEVTAPREWRAGAAVPVLAAASAAGLSAADIATARHAPLLASSGTEFCIAEVVDEAALERARPVAAAFDGMDLGVGLLIYTGADPIRARMFAPPVGVPEDPATGGAACALAGLLAQLGPAEQSGSVRRIEQGISMGRPSLLLARAERTASGGWRTFVAGSSVLVATGSIRTGDA